MIEGMNVTTQLLNFESWDLASYIFTSGQLLIVEQDQKDVTSHAFLGKLPSMADPSFLKKYALSILLTVNIQHLKDIWS